jgi:hypothetical protein
MSPPLPAPFAWPPWAQMWALAVTIYAGCKWITWQRTPAHRVRAWKHWAYLIAWPGMDASRFLEDGPEARPAPCRDGEWIGATVRLACGVALLFGVARMIPPAHPYLVGWIGMLGIVLILHFGVFHLLSCSWRRLGTDARPLMNHPLASTSVGEFWGRRWNTAFRDLTHRFLYRPATSWGGPRLGLVLGFGASGLIHDIVLSVPAHGGYGGPTAYFLIQGTAVVIERSEPGRRLGLGSGWPGRAFAMSVLLAPAGLLLHSPFVVGIIVPFMRALGALR